MKEQSLITKELAVKVNKVLCNMDGHESGIRDKGALEEVFKEVQTTSQKEHNDPLWMLSCIVLGLVNEEPFENCNKRTALVLFNYYLEKYCGFKLADNDQYKYVENFKKLDNSGKFNDEFRKWVQEYIDLRIFAKTNDTDFIYP